MPTDNSLIMGERRPLAGTAYQYRLRVQYETVRWEVWYGTQCLVENDSGSFSFKNPSLGIGLVIRAYYTTKAMPGLEMHAELAVKPIPGKPKFLKILWYPAGSPLTYLDDIRLLVETVNIVPGDRLSAQIMEKEKLSDRSVGRTLYAEVDEAGIARFKVSAELLKQFAEKANAKDWFKDIVYEYYAEVSYYGAEIPDEKQTFISRPEDPPPEIKPVVKKSDVLNVVCNAKLAKSPENGIKPVFIEKEKTENKEKDPVKLKLNIFFDGTKNNLTNVLAKEHAKNNSATSDEKAAYEKHKKGDNSYNQGFSNVAILKMCDGYKKTEKEISVYIEGIGTEDLKGDSTAGMALGMGATGIKAKVEKAINKIFEEIYGENGAVNVKSELVVKASVNVFGFSRGSAAARHFVSKKSEIALNVGTAKKNVEFTFVGLFDTVAAYGLFHALDTVQLSLNIGDKALKVVQLTAGDEYRLNFNLTNIKSSIQAGRGYELELPGAHSDTGGGYLESIPEKVNSLQCGLSTVNRLIEEGWYTEEQRRPGRYIYSTLEREVTNQYQYIPLEIMAIFACDYGNMKFTDELTDIYIALVPPDLATIRDKYKFVDTAVKKDGAHSIKLLDNLNFSVDDKKSVYNKYLHLSAYAEGGQTSVTDYFANVGHYDSHNLPKRGVLDG